MIRVAGDIIRDQYILGTAERLSPEAPVPVVKVLEIEERPGGAANVARNIESLGGEVELYGKGEMLKTRVVCDGQQVCRIDYDDECEPLIDFPPPPEIVVFSDYAKGSLKHIRQFIRRSPYSKVLVDPKGDFEKYSGAYLLKPNKKEFESVSSGDMIESAQSMRREYNIHAFCITLGPGGMILIEDNVWEFPSIAKEVFDVTGAGDTVIAVIAYCLDLGMNLFDSVRYANIAAGKVVQKLGSATVTADEIGLG